MNKFAPCLSFSLTSHCIQLREKQLEEEKKLLEDLALSKKHQEELLREEQEKLEKLVKEKEDFALQYEVSLASKTSLPHLEFQMSDSN